MEIYMYVEVIQLYRLLIPISAPARILGQRGAG